MKIKWFLGFVCLTVLLFGCNEVREHKTLYLAHTLPQSHPVHQGILVFQKALNDNSKGKLQLKVFPDGMLGTEREVLELLQIGSIAVTKVSAATLSNFVPDYHVFALPYLFRDSQHQLSVLEGEVGKSILQKGEKYWLRGLCYYDAGSRSFYTSNKGIKTPEDLKGLKIRVMDNQMSIQMINTLGASATPMAYGELYTAIQQGVVDGAENNTPSFVSSNHHEVSKFLTLDEHSSIPDVLIISSKFWNQLSKQEQSWVQDAANKSAIAQREFWRKAEEESLAKIRNAGVEIIIPDKQLFEQKSLLVIEDFKKQYPELAGTLAKIKSK